MIEIPRDSPGSAACGYSGRPLLAICPAGHRRTVPFRLLKTAEDDRSPLYGRPFKCPACASPEVTLFAIESQDELEALRDTVTLHGRRPSAPTTHPPPDPRKGLL